MSHLYASSLLVPLALAAWWDLRHRRIPNEISLTIVALWLGAVALGVSGPKLAAIGTGMSLLVLGILAWRCGWLGGGDVKLIAALGLWAGPSHVDALLFGTALTGGILAVATWFAGRLSEWPPAGLALAMVDRLLPSTQFAPNVTSWRSQGLPYGIAVAAGGGWMVQRLLAA